MQAGSAWSGGYGVDEFKTRLGRIQYGRWRGLSSLHEGLWSCLYAKGTDAYMSLHGGG